MPPPLPAAFDVATDPRKPRLHKVVEPEEIQVKQQKLEPVLGASTVPLQRQGGCRQLRRPLMLHHNARAHMWPPAPALCRARRALHTFTPRTAWPRARCASCLRADGTESGGAQLCQPAGAAAIAPQQIPCVCLPLPSSTTQVMVSAMGDPEGNAKGGFVLLDNETFEVGGGNAPRCCGRKGQRLN